MGADNKQGVVTGVELHVDAVALSAMKIAGDPHTAAASLIIAAVRLAAMCGVPPQDLVTIIDTQYPVAAAVVAADGPPPFQLAKGN